MKFVGVIQNENQYFGLVQVGERVYRVQQNEAIGSGKWRVAAIDETRMQLVVNGKLVTYDK
jgi:Tfp pilus assembly protein PilP